MLLARSIQGQAIGVNEEFCQAYYTLKHGAVEAGVILTTSSLS